MKANLAALPTAGHPREQHLVLVLQELGFRGQIVRILHELREARAEQGGLEIPRVPHLQTSLQGPHLLHHGSDRVLAIGFVR